MVGRLIERKGFQVALRALAAFSRETQTPIKVDIVGDGAMRPSLEALVTDLGLGASVHFHGARTHSEIAGYLRNTDVFLAPSMTSARGGQDAPAINRLMDKRANWPQLVTRARAKVEEMYDLDRVTQKLVALYERTIAQENALSKA